MISVFGSQLSNEGLLQSWMMADNHFPLKYVLVDCYDESVHLDLRMDLINQLSEVDEDGQNPLHVIACNQIKKDADCFEMVKLLMETYNKEEDNRKKADNIGASSTKRKTPPMLITDKHGKTPIHSAIREGKDKLALYLFSLVDDKSGFLKDEENKNILFYAIGRNCIKFAESLLEMINNEDNNKELEFLLTNDQNGSNILHHGYKFSGTNKQLIIDIVEKNTDFINSKNDHEKCPLDYAAENGATWLVELLLKKDRLCIAHAPSALIGACDGSHVSTVLAFIKGCPYIRSICRDLKDSPLHHLKGLNYEDYQELLNFPVVMDLRNSINSDGRTPLHIAVLNGDANLMEILLTMKDVDRNIKDKKGQTAMHLLELAWKERDDVKQFCKLIEVDPTSKLTYIQSSTDPADMRTIISLVAALLATITFTAGFTLPGGLDGNNVQATLAQKPSFVVFLIADSYAMCCSMLVLFCIIWSMLSPYDESLFLIDRSLVLLKQSLYGTLIAFAVGVYLVIYQKTLWTSILIFVLCTLVVVLTGRTTLRNALKLIPAATDEQWWCFWNK